MQYNSPILILAFYFSLIRASREREGETRIDGWMEGGKEVFFAIGKKT